MKPSRRTFLTFLGGLSVADSWLPSWPYWARDSSVVDPKGNSGILASLAAAPDTKIPLIHCTDLYHPPGDPDDHVDLATVFALPQFDLKAIILDHGVLQAATPGKIPVEQMMTLTGRRVPYATGLGTPLRHPEDDGLNQFRHYQGGVELILRTLRESKEKVTFMVVGSARDVIAAYNRDPDVFRRKAGRIYFDDGNSGGGDFQWNPLLDSQAFIRLMTADLPVYWCPAFAKQDTLEAMAAGELKPDATRVYWNFRQSEVFSALPVSLQKFFLYALGRKDAAAVDFLAYLERPLEETLRDAQWQQTRHMWSTAPIYHAAGCELYRSGDSWAALPEPVPGYQHVSLCDFVPARAAVDRDLRVTADFTDHSTQFRVFRIIDLPNYQHAMQSSLTRCLSKMDLAPRYRSLS